VLALSRGLSETTLSGLKFARRADERLGTKAIKMRSPERGI
jgi:hypothetical protein